MKSIVSPLRSGLVAAAVLATLLMSMATGVAASSFNPRHPTPGATKVAGTGVGDTRRLPNLGDPNLPAATFMGLITSVDGPDTGDPSGFTLDLGMLSQQIRLAQKTMITGKTAEAVVEGLATGDYAVVHAKRFRGIWYATRVVFDVQPVAPLRLISGTITRITKDLKHFVVKPDTGKGAFLLRIVRQTRFHMDGRPIDAAPQDWSFGPAELPAQTLIRRDNGVWTAYDIYLRSAT